MTPTVSDLVTAVREIAAENPDFIYDPLDDICVYKPNDRNPHGCIINYALNRIGIEYDNEWEGEDVIEVLRFCLLPKDKIIINYNEDETRIKWLMSVQSSQDNECSWSDAVICADVEVEI